MLLRTLWARERLLGRQHGNRGGCRADKRYGTFETASREGGENGLPASPPNPLDSAGANWMAFIDDETLMSALTLPGTHDSAAFTISWPFVQTQKMDVTYQLDAGIRYFDLRCAVRGGVVEMVHGLSYLGITLSTVLDAMYTWLMFHESEAIVVQIKQDRGTEDSDMHFAQAIWKVLHLKPERWRTANTAPALGELRGKIQLLRRFKGPSMHALGIDVSKWQDNPERPFTIHTRHGVNITIQDHYSFSGHESLPHLVTKKGGDVAELLNRASADPTAGHWYINFTSAFEFNLYYQLPPKQVALGGYWGFRWEEGMNLRLRNYLRERPGRRRFGIVAMDFPESGAEDLITTLIQSNFGSRSGGSNKKQLIADALLVLLVIFLFGLAISPYLVSTPKSWWRLDNCK